MNFTATVNGNVVSIGAADFTEAAKTLRALKSMYAPLTEESELVVKE